MARKFFWYSLKACMKCSNVPTCNQTTSLKHCKFQELQVISAGRCLHMNISRFQVPSHEIAKAYLFLTISNFSLQSFLMERVQIVLWTLKHVYLLHSGCNVIHTNHGFTFHIRRRTTMKNFDFCLARIKVIWLIPLKWVWFTVYNSYPQMNRGCSQLFHYSSHPSRTLNKKWWFFLLVWILYEYFNLNGCGLVPKFMPTGELSLQPMISSLFTLKRTPMQNLALLSTS